MKKIDFTKELKHLYNPPVKVPVRVDVPAMNYLMIDGAGDPNTAPAFAAGVEALFPLAYTLKFMVKKGPLAIDYGVLPLEALWWADTMTAFATGDKSSWQWTLMIMQPDFITPEMVASALAEVHKKKKLPALAQVRFEALAEGACAQIMHIGPFSEEGLNIEKVHRFIQESGGSLTGKHHEIYLSDIRRAAPEKWKTVIRQPLR